MNVNDEYTRRRNNILTLLELGHIDNEFIIAIREALDMAYEMGFEEGRAAEDDE